VSLTVYSWTFLAQHDLDGDSIAFGPLPGYVAVVKGCDATLGALDLGNVALIGSAGQVVWTDSFLTTSPTTKSYRGGYVLFPTETAFVQTTAAMDVNVWGYMLYGPPPS
jgi:hypothetical protein